MGRFRMPGPTRRTVDRKADAWSQFEPVRAGAGADGLELAQRVALPVDGAAHRPGHAEPAHGVLPAAAPPAAPPTAGGSPSDESEDEFDMSAAMEAPRPAPAPARQGSNWLHASAFRSTVRRVGPGMRNRPMGSFRPPRPVGKRK